MAVSPDQSGIAEVSAAEAPRNLEGALWMTASGLVFTVFLTLSKVQSAEYDPGFLAFFRSFIALILTLPVIMQQGWGIMRIHQPGMVLLRSLFGTMGFIFGFYAVSAQFGLPLSEFNAISFSRAMFITVLAAGLLKETVGWHRWGATLAGFIGVLIMTQPQAGVSLGTLLALAAAFCYGRGDHTGEAALPQSPAGYAADLGEFALLGDAVAAGSLEDAGGDALLAGLGHDHTDGRLRCGRAVFLHPRHGDRGRLVPVADRLFAPAHGRDSGLAAVQGAAGTVDLGRYIHHHRCDGLYNLTGTPDAAAAVRRRLKVLFEVFPCE
jgi:uncharacterized membrane protein